MPSLRISKSSHFFRA